MDPDPEDLELAADMHQRGHDWHDIAETLYVTEAVAERYADLGRQRRAELDAQHQTALF